jgi:hypothetical protein
MLPIALLLQEKIVRAHARQSGPKPEKGLI